MLHYIGFFLLIINSVWILYFFILTSSPEYKIIWNTSEDVLFGSLLAICALLGLMHLVRTNVKAQHFLASLFNVLFSLLVGRTYIQIRLNEQIYQDTVYSTIFVTVERNYNLDEYRQAFWTYVKKNHFGHRGIFDQEVANTLIKDSLSMRNLFNKIDDYAKTKVPPTFMDILWNVVGYVEHAVETYPIVTTIVAIVVTAATFYGFYWFSNRSELQRLEKRIDQVQNYSVNKTLKTNENLGDIKKELTDINKAHAELNGLIDGLQARDVQLEAKVQALTDNRTSEIQGVLYDMQLQKKGLNKLNVAFDNMCADFKDVANDMGVAGKHLWALEDMLKSHEVKFGKVGTSLLTNHTRLTNLEERVSFQTTAIGTITRELGGVKESVASTLADFKHVMLHTLTRDTSWLHLEND